MDCNGLLQPEIDLLEHSASFAGNGDKLGILANNSLWIWISIGAHVSQCALAENHPPQDKRAQIVEHDIQPYSSVHVPVGAQAIEKIAACGTGQRFVEGDKLKGKACYG